MLRTAASVAGQSHRDLEWLVIDGGSDDGTPERVRALPRPPDVLVSERDRGIAHAFNKGVALAGGEALVFLNAGDAFADPDALAAMLAAWDRPRHRWLTAGASVVGADGRPMYDRMPPAGSVGRLINHGCRIWHAATILESALLREVGTYDESFRSSMDYELWVRLIARQAPPQVLARVCARFHLGGTSGDLARRLAEDRRARRLHGRSLGLCGEALLSAVNRAKMLSAAIGRPRWLYRCKERLGL